jgi:hypothetical protein
MKMKKQEKAELLLELGMKEAAEKLLRKGFGKKKLLKAVDNYRYATGEDLDDFNKDMKQYGKELVVVEIKDYDRIPPDEVLEALKAAQGDECFDSFHIAYIRKVKDPILFGKIDDFKNLYFFIAQWGDDVKIEDIIGTE